MWSMLSSLLLGLLKWFASKKAKTKLNDEQFIKFIEAHQKRRLGAGKTADDFEAALEEALKENNES